MVDDINPCVHNVSPPPPHMAVGVEKEVESEAERALSDPRSIITLNQIMNRLSEKPGDAGHV